MQVKTRLFQISQYKTLFPRISNIDRDYCVGRSSSRGSQKGRSCGMNHSCMAVTHVKDMLLTCDDGSKRKYPVTFTTECKCQPTSNQASRYPFLTWIWLIKMIRNHLASTWIMKMTHKPISSFNFHLSWNILVQNKTWLYHINYIPYHYLVTFDHYWSFFTANHRWVKLKTNLKPKYDLYLITSCWLPSIKQIFQLV